MDITRAHKTSRPKRRDRIEMTTKTHEFVTSRLTLNNGVEMPKIGLGTYKISSTSDIEVAVDAALSAGYRLLDTAAVYGNETALGKALPKLLSKHNLTRDDIFVTTKLPPGDLGNYEVVNASYQKSMDNMGIGQADLYLIQSIQAKSWCVQDARTKISPQEARNKALRHTTWRALSQIYDEGRVNAIGVANFTLQHLKDLDIKANEIMPAVNQVEWHPYYYQEDLLDYCRKNDICVQAYSSFGGASSGDLALVEDPVVKRIADNHAAWPTQVLLAWALQQGVAVLPKSVHPQRIVDNISIDFLLTEKEIRELNALRTKGRKYAWDPTDVR